MKKLVMLLVVLVFVYVGSGCAPISGFSFVAGAADSLSFRAERELIQHIKTEHKVWHVTD